MPHQHVFIFLLWPVIANAGQSLWNAALKKPAYQISTGCGGEASLATDGTDFIKSNNDTCSFTKAEMSPTWWLVDLLGVYKIEEVLISNIGDDRSYWLGNFTIDLFTKDPRQSMGFLQQLGTVFHSHNGSGLSSGIYGAKASAPGMLGRFVRIVKYNNMPLVLCEVKVMTKAIVESCASYRKRSSDPVQLQLPLVSVQTGSRLQCAMLCTRKRDAEQCRFFTWFPDTNQCHLLASAPMAGELSGRIAINGQAYGDWNIAGLV